MKVIFLCHGNICRSVMAEYVFKNILIQKGLENDFEVVSRATSTEEIGNDIYPPCKKVLDSHNIKYQKHYARQITKKEYDDADYVLVMENYNISNLKRIVSNIDYSKVYLLRTWSSGNKEISDPWYDGRYEQVFNEIYEGCHDFLKNVVFN